MKKDKTIIPELRNIRKCSKRCKLFPCVYVDESNKLDGNCALKQMPYVVQRRLVRFYLEGKEGVLSELNDLKLKLARFDVDRVEQ